MQNIELEISKMEKNDEKENEIIDINEINKLDIIEKTSDDISLIITKHLEKKKAKLKS